MTCFPSCWDYWRRSIYQEILFLGNWKRKAGLSIWDKDLTIKTKEQKTWIHLKGSVSSDISNAATPSAHIPCLLTHLFQLSRAMCKARQKMCNHHDIQLPPGWLLLWDRNLAGAPSPSWRPRFPAHSHPLHFSCRSTELSGKVKARFISRSCTALLCHSSPWSYSTACSDDLCVLPLKIPPCL